MYVRIGGESISMKYEWVCNSVFITKSLSWMMIFIEDMQLSWQTSLCGFLRFFQQNRLSVTNVKMFSCFINIECVLFSTLHGSGMTLLHITSEKSIISEQLFRSFYNIFLCERRFGQPQSKQQKHKKQHHGFISIIITSKEVCLCCHRRGQWKLEKKREKRKNI